MLIKLIPDINSVITITTIKGDEKIFLIDIFNENGNYAPKHFPTFPLELITLRGKANDSASELDSSLKRLITEYIYLNKNKIDILKLEDFTEFDNYQEIQNKVNKIEFMKRRSILSDVLKKDPRLGGKSKNTKILFDFIEERNKYAHGIFCLLLPDYNPMIQFELTGKAEYAFISSDIIYSFLKTYLDLDSWFNSLNSKIQDLAKF